MKIVHTKNKKLISIRLTKNYFAKADLKQKRPKFYMLMQLPSQLDFHLKL